MSAYLLVLLLLLPNDGVQEVSREYVSASSIAVCHQLGQQRAADFTAKAGPTIKRLRASLAVKCIQLETKT